MDGEAVAVLPEVPALVGGGFVHAGDETGVGVVACGAGPCAVAEGLIAFEVALIAEIEGGGGVEDGCGADAAVWFPEDLAGGFEAHGLAADGSDFVADAFG